MPPPVTRQPYDPFGGRRYMSPGLSQNIDQRVQRYYAGDFPRAVFGETFGGAIDSVGDTLSGIMPALGQAAMLPFTGGGPAAPAAVPGPVVAPRAPAGTAAAAPVVAPAAPKAQPPVTRTPWNHATPMSDVDPWNPSGEAQSQGQLEQDYAAHESINARHAQAMKAIKDAEESRGDPMRKKIEAEGLNAVYEDLMPLPGQTPDKMPGAGTKEDPYTATEPPMRRGQARDIDTNVKNREHGLKTMALARMAKAAEALIEATNSGDEALIKQAQKAYDIISEMVQNATGKFPPREGQAIINVGP